MKPRSASYCPCFFWVGYPLTGKHARALLMDVENIAMFGTAPRVIQAHHKKQIPSHRGSVGSVVADDLGEVPSLPTAFVRYFVDFMVLASLLWLIMINLLFSFEHDFYCRFVCFPYVVGCFSAVQLQINVWVGQSKSQWEISFPFQPFSAVVACSFCIDTVCDGFLKVWLNRVMPSGCFVGASVAQWLWIKPCPFMEIYMTLQGNKQMRLWIEPGWHWPKDHC